MEQINTEQINTEQINLAAHLRATTTWTARRVVNDLMAMEEDDARQSSHKGLRSAVQIVAHCAAVTRTFASLVKTSAPPEASAEEKGAFPAAITTREEAVTALTAATEELYGAIDSVDADRWGEAVEGLFGPTLLSLAGFAALHLLYHDGQLNQMHLLQGDQEMHWA